jgi:hypothetical protein
MCFEVTRRFNQLKGTHFVFYDVLIHLFCWHYRQCKEELKQQDGHVNIDKWLAKGFAQWFETHVRSLAMDQLTE